MAALVPKAAKVVDVGSDHGYLSIFLVEQGIASAVIATDIRPGPLASAKRNVCEAGLSENIQLRLCDGLEAVSPPEADVILIAGMGGETIIGILERARWAWSENRLLVLQPQSKQTELRKWLYQNGCGIRSEHLAQDAGRLYPILCAGGPVGPEPSPAELLVGSWPLPNRDRLFYTYLEREIEKLERAIGGLSDSQKSGSASRLQLLRTQLEELRQMRK